MAADDPLRELRELAEAGEKVFGPEEKQRALFTHHCRHGDWLCIGAWGGIGLSYFSRWPIWVLVIIAIVVGYVANEYEKREIEKRLRAEISAGH